MIKPYIYIDQFERRPVAFWTQSHRQPGAYGLLYRPKICSSVQHIDVCYCATYSTTHVIKMRRVAPFQRATFSNLPPPFGVPATHAQVPRSAFQTRSAGVAKLRLLGNTPHRQCHQLLRLLCLLQQKLFQIVMILLHSV